MTRTKHVLDSRGAVIREPYAIDLLGSRWFLAIGMEEGLGGHPHRIENLE